MLNWDFVFKELVKKIVREQKSQTFNAASKKKYVPLFSVTVDKP